MQICYCLILFLDRNLQLNIDYPGLNKLSIRLFMLDMKDGSKDNPNISINFRVLYL